MKFHATLPIAAVAAMYTLNLSGASAQDNSADLPPASGPGECFARVLLPEVTEIQTERVVDQEERTEIKVIPATYETVEETVLVKEASTESKFIPATYKTVTEEVLIKEATVTYTNIPAVYETVTETVIIEPERTESIVIPATFETYTEQVLVREAYTTWKQGENILGRDVSPTSISSTTGELLCLVEVPAEYETVERTRVKTPERTETRVIPAVTETVTKRVVIEEARVEEVQVPAVFETVTREVIDQPARVEEVPVAAEYKTVSVQKLVTPKQEETIVIPATYKTIEKSVITAPGGFEWREVLCDTNSSPALIRELQVALTAAGYDTPADGVFGNQTLDSMEAFQRANGLPIGYMTMSTVEKLGVDVNRIGLSS